MFRIERNFLRPNRTLLATLQTAQDLACEIYLDKSCTSVGLAIGSYAGYGSYLTRYCVKSRIIELPINPSFNNILMNGRRTFDVQDPNYLIGCLLHEYAHHSQHHSKNRPWDELGLKAGKGRHSNDAWCWLCSRGWLYFYPQYSEALTPENLAWAVRKLKKRNLLAHYVPNQDPGWLVEKIIKAMESETHYCENCSKPFTPRRSDAMYCSTKCRVQACRARAKQED